MDERDTEILKALVKNARISYVELSKKLKISEAAVRKRVKKLEANGVVKGFTALVDPETLGYSAVAIIGIDTKPDELMSVLELVKGMKDVRYAALSSGDHMIIFEAWCKDQSELSSLIKKVKGAQGVTKICPAILLKSKEFSNR
ncbi:MAG: Lrp/AsnC family transcriptional regulator [Candidatus Micrarchaeota archaeon]